MRIFDAILGYCRVRFDKKDEAAVHNLLFRLHMDYWGCGEKENVAFLKIRARQRDYLSSFAKKENIPLEVGRIEGLPRIFLRYADRYGVWLGCFFAVCIVTLSSLFVWDVRVTGNHRVGKTEITEALKEYGVGIGAFLPTLDLHEATNSFLIDSQEIGWLSLYRKGNVIYAKVLEKEDIDVQDTSPPKVGQGANLVADEDALILSYALVRGKPALRVGQVVRRGELLASGILEGSADTSFVMAEGEVLGQVTRHISLHVPFTYEENVTLDTKEIGKSVNIFGKIIKISKDTGNLPPEYDTIECKEQIYLFGRIALPLFLHRTYGVMYEKNTVQLTETEAARAAYARLRTETARALADGTLLARDVKGHFTDEGYTLECTLTFSRNIARQVAFSFENEKTAQKN